MKYVIIPGAEIPFTGPHRLYSFVFKGVLATDPSITRKEKLFAAPLLYLLPLPT